MSANAKTDLILSTITDVFEDCSGIDITEFERDTDFFEMGLDSLVLTQVALGIENEFAVKITFRELMEQYDNPSVLADHLVSSLGDDFFAGKLSEASEAPAPAPEPVVEVAPEPEPAAPGP